MPPTDHASHDLHVLAAAADRQVDDTTRVAAATQVACPDCAALFADLRLISAGLADLPRELAVSRDFRITPERAARLRPAGWRGVLQGLLGSGPSVRPFASVLTTLGIAGLLLTVGLPGLFGGLSATSGAAGGAQPELLSTVGQSVGGKSNESPAPAALPAEGPGGADAGASRVPDRVVDASPGAHPTDTSNGYTSVGTQAPALGTGTDSAAVREQSSRTPAGTIPVLGLLAAVSLGVLVLGVVLLIRSRARPFDSIG